jgi:hypothetical protein
MTALSQIYLVILSYQAKETADFITMSLQILVRCSWQLVILLWLNWLIGDWGTYTTEVYNNLHLWSMD